MKNKMGFTLVELLAVIVILAIILVIAVPKIMNTIDDARKASLESSAKMIAAEAENQYTISQTLGTEFETSNGNCLEAKWAGLNKIDYSSCSYNIEDGKATVTLVGANKFEGKYVCNGTRVSASVTDEECGTKIEYGVLSTFIKNLYNTSAVENGLINPIIDNEDGTTIDTGIRYAGDGNVVKNRIWFNCKDEVNGKQYGEEGYEYNSANCELWRIVGVFDTASSEGGSAVSRTKIVKDTSILNASWDSSDQYTNKGYGVNQWGDTASYEGADLMKVLNRYYIDGTSTCVYCNDEGQSTCPVENDCSSSIISLSVNSKKLIDPALWYLGAVEVFRDDELSVEKLYKEERGTLNGKQYCVDAPKVTKVYCNDTVERSLKWVGKVGLIYPSDYVYASTNNECSFDILSPAPCKLNNWLDKGNSYWTITPASVADTGAHFAWGVDSSSGVSNISGRITNGVHPAVYLKNTVEIVDGNGLDKPYVIKKID